MQQSTTWVAPQAETIASNFQPDPIYQSTAVVNFKTEQINASLILQSSHSAQACKQKKDEQIILVFLLHSMKLLFTKPIPPNPAPSKIIPIISETLYIYLIGFHEKSYFLSCYLLFISQIDRPSENKHSEFARFCFQTAFYLSAAYGINRVRVRFLRLRRRVFSRCIHSRGRGGRCVRRWFRHLRPNRP